VRTPSTGRPPVCSVALCRLVIPALLLGVSVLLQAAAAAVGNPHPQHGPALALTESGHGGHRVSLISKKKKNTPNTVNVHGRAASSR